jgi:glucose-1-phosphate thymidylyltransferase
LKGVILAAGKGTRLYPVTYHVAKPLLPMANRVTLEYAFDRLKEIGVTDVCVVVGEMEEQIRQILQDGACFGVHLTYVRQTSPHGLAHAVGFAKEFVANDSFVLYLGDGIYGTKFNQYAERFLASGCANLNLVKPVEDPWRYGIANVCGERIVKLVEKPKSPESNLAMTGVYFFGPQLWDVLPDLKPSARGEYEITDAIQLLIDKGETVLAGVYDAPWFDTGTLDSFLETSAFLAKGVPLVAESAVVEAEIGPGVVVGERAVVRCASIEDAVVLPDARVDVEGDIKHCLLGGRVHDEFSLENVILYEAPGEKT